MILGDGVDCGPSHRFEVRERDRDDGGDEDDDVIGGPCDTGRW